MAAVCFLFVAREASGTEAWQLSGVVQSNFWEPPCARPSSIRLCLGCFDRASPGSGHKAQSEEAVRTLEPVKKSKNIQECVHTCGPSVTKTSGEKIKCSYFNLRKILQGLGKGREVASR